jgi:hypothetical protein
LRTKRLVFSKLTALHSPPEVWKFGNRDAISESVWQISKKTKETYPPCPSKRRA